MTCTYMSWFSIAKMTYFVIQLFVDTNLLSSYQSYNAVFTDIAMQLLSLYDLEQQQTADGEQQQHLYNMQDVMQGVQKGELFLSESSTITQGQFQRAVEGHTQRLASRPGSDIAGKKGLMHHANVQPSTESPFKQQRNYNAERRLDDADEEYNELFATANC